MWEIPAVRMKLRLHLKDDDARNHLVPLAPQTVEAIAALRRMTGAVRSPFRTSATHTGPCLRMRLAICSTVPAIIITMSRTAGGQRFQQ